MSGSTVLIVDDERTLARAIKAFLTESGYVAEIASDAEIEAIFRRALDFLVRLDAGPPVRAR